MNLRDDQDELEFTATVPAGHGGWLAAHAVGRDKSEAVTTPVYVVRPGFRFWDVTQAAVLIQKQLTVLDEAEKAVQEAQTVVESGRQPLDYWNRWPAEQAAALRERIGKMHGAVAHHRADRALSLSSRFRRNEPRGCRLCSQMRASSRPKAEMRTGCRRPPIFCGKAAAGESHQDQGNSCSNSANELPNGILCINDSRILFHDGRLCVPLWSE